MCLKNTRGVMWIAVVFIVIFVKSTPSSFVFLFFLIINRCHNTGGNCYG